MLLLTLRETYTLNTLSSFQNLRRKGGKFDHSPERPKVLQRHWSTTIVAASIRCTANPQQIELRESGPCAALWWVILSIRPNGQSEIICTRLKLYRLLLDLTRVRPMSHLRFHCAILSCGDKIASVTWLVAHICRRRATLFRIEQCSIRCDFVTFVCLTWFNAVVGPGIAGIDDPPSLFPLVLTSLSFLAAKWPP